MYLNYYRKINREPGKTAQELSDEVYGIINTIEVDESDRKTTSALLSYINKVNASKFMHTIDNGDIDLDEIVSYTEFRIPKASGGYRVINAPDPKLKELQKEFANLLIKDCRVLCHNAVHSYVKKRNTLTALKAHQERGNKYFLKVDISRFFDSISVNMLCNALDNIVNTKYISSIIRNNTDIQKILFLNGVLPQGSPASPILSNLVLQEFDTKFNQYCWNRSITYTRYADDLIISCRHGFVFSEILDIINELLPDGLIINREKVRYGSCYGSNWNLGLMYNKNLDVTVGAEQKHKIQCAYHNLYRDKPEDFNARLASLKGLFNYYRYIEPEYFDRLAIKLQNKGYEI